MPQKHSTKLLDKYKSWLAKSDVNYEPWLKVYDVSSIGVSSIVFGRTTNRNHHCLSLNELSIFLLADWDDNVGDIKEQFALDPVVTSLLAKEASITHPSVRGRPIVMTTDLLIKQNNKNESTAIQVKPSEELEDPRTVEKLELERRYWRRKETSFVVLTEKDVSKTVVENVRWIQPILNEQVETEELSLKLDLYLHVASQSAPTMPIRLLCQKIDTSYSLMTGESLKDLRQLVAHRFIRVEKILFRLGCHLRSLRWPFLKKAQKE